MTTAGTLRVHALANDAWTIVGGRLGSAATVLADGAGRALLIDTLASRADAEALAGWLAAAGLEVGVVVMTHYFSDHMAGLALFPEAEVVAHQPASKPANSKDEEPEDDEEEEARSF